MPPLAITLVLVSTLLHAGWNVLAKRSGDTAVTFPRVLLVIAIPGLLVGLLAEWRGMALLPQIWPYLLTTGVFQAAYFLGLTMGYRAGDLSLVYPLVRALPVLLLGIFDVVRGHLPGTVGWLGLSLVLGGCLLVALPAPLRGSGSDAAGTPWNRQRAAVGWAAVAALGMVGYTILDKLAADAMAAGGGGGGAAFRYGLWELTTTAAYYLPVLAVINRNLRRDQPPQPRSRAKAAVQPARGLLTVAMGVLIYTAYGLVLWAYQLSWQISYVVALRQFSIVIGVAIGVLFLGEAAPAPRIAGAVVIVAGVAALTFIGGR